MEVRHPLRRKEVRNEMKKILATAAIIIITAPSAFAGCVRDVSVLANDVLDVRSTSVPVELAVAEFPAAANMVRDAYNIKMAVMVGPSAIPERINFVNRWVAASCNVDTWTKNERPVN